MRRYAQPELTLVKTSLHGIPRGYLGTRKTLVHIQELIRQGAKDFYVRQKAIDILLKEKVRPKDYLGEINALFEWVRHNVRYTKDPFRVETLHTARRLLELRAGDCDDMTILLAAMLESIGHPIRLVIIGPDPGKPRLFSHIYLEAHYKGNWIPLDATMPFPMGWSPKALVKEVIPINRRNPKMSAKMGLGATPIETQPTDWLRGLVRSIAGEAVPPRDPRVKMLYDLLRRRQLLGRSPWLKGRLVLIWQRGLAARRRPRLTRRLVELLRSWGLLPAGEAVLQPLVATTVRLGPYWQRRPYRRRPRAGLRPLRVMAVRRLRPLSVRRISGRRLRGLAGNQP